MNPFEFAKYILCSENINDKLLHVSVIDWTQKLALKESQFKNFDLSNIGIPHRSSTIKFSDKKIKFPKQLNSFNKEQLAIVIHSFANHELQALEIMSYVILKFFELNTLKIDNELDECNETKKNLKSIIKTLSEEQEHFKLYLQSLNDLGYAFGDFPLNDFFWKHFYHLKSLDEYFSLMALTFESANLDFMAKYKIIFKELNLEKLVVVVDKVLQDELSHVAVGVKYLNTQAKLNKMELWNYYLMNLPFPITPMRSKGPQLNLELRKKAGLEDAFLTHLINYDDGYAITKRKEWKTI